jgi:ribulose-5-phosphate 4-epimerase/fuculose-1-phosphate aldolase
MLEATHSPPAAAPLDALRRARHELAAAYRLAARAGYDDGIWNHFSLRVPGRPEHFLVKSHGLTFDEVTAGNLVVVDAMGKVTEGVGSVEESAFQIHAHIQAMRSDIQCALHAHPLYATALTSRRDGRLRMVHQDSLHFFGRVAYHDEYNGLALDASEARRITSALSGADVLFLRQHGVIVLGRSVADAVYHLDYLELACRRQLAAETGGAELLEIPDEVAAMTVAQFEDERDESSRLSFAAQLRRLDREEPDYAG